MHTRPRLDIDGPRISFDAVEISPAPGVYRISRGVYFVHPSWAVRLSQSIPNRKDRLRSTHRTAARRRLPRYRKCRRYQSTCNMRRHTISAIASSFPIPPLQSRRWDMSRSKGPRDVTKIGSGRTAVSPSGVQRRGADASRTSHTPAVS